MVETGLLDIMSEFEEHEIYRDTYSTSQKVCPHCKFSCVDTVLLRQHIQNHKMKRFECRYCPYKTDKKGNMKVHIMIHTGEKPFSCDFCSYKATHRRSVLNHTLKKHYKNDRTLMSKNDLQALQQS